MSSNKSELETKLKHLHLIFRQLAFLESSDQVLNDEAIERFNGLAIHAQNLNPWFTEESIQKSLEGFAFMLRPEAVKLWLTKYELTPKDKKRIGLVLAGNLPMVGFHDILAVLVSGNHPVVKLSSQDRLLLPTIFELFNKTSSNGPFDITWLEDRKLDDIDAIIATGSNNSSRYFEYYFGKYPNIIRKNRNSVAVISGTETDEELKLLGEDIFSYFGLGCRNVAKLYVKDNFDLDRFFGSIIDYNPIVNHNKYANNYDYYKALWLMNQEDLLDNGFLLLRKSESISSPVGTLFYERYSKEDNLLDKLSAQSEEIQCIVSKNDVPFGKSQKPELWDYADGVDTLEFLESIE
ncbi:acyl-CoA reductase [Cryomorphaceae bacterium 1068]|nr:acyl-CoA reductase [Cryomorphaceae bacterium 1068]